MRQHASIILFFVLAAHVYAAPQLISFKDGKIGVNFAGYHAAAGLGGILGGGAGGGLFAEAGTPHGQAARAGLGGAVDSDGGTAGGLYAGATAGGNVKAHAGLGGGVVAEKAAGTGFAEAQAGDHIASSGLGGESSIAGSSGFSFSGTKSFGLSKGVVKQVEVHPVETIEVVQPVQTVEVVKEVEVAKPIHKEIHSEVKVEATNEVKPLPVAVPKADFAADFAVKAEASPPVYVKEVYVQPPPAKVYHKEIIRTHYKPRRHHFHKTAYIGGYLGGGGGFDVPPPPPAPAPVVYKTVQPAVYKTVQIQPAIEKRVDVGVESSAGTAGEIDVSGGSGHGGGAQFGYTKQFSVQRNPSFFQDIFNIPISTLKAVGSFLGNAAGSTSVSVQKSASVQAGAQASGHAESDSLSSPSPKHESSEAAVVSIQTPSATKIIDDILAIPINTLGAVNKFLENNVPARKNVQISEDGELTRVRLGPHARRRANKRVVIVEEPAEPAESSPNAA